MDEVELEARTKTIKAGEAKVGDIDVCPLLGGTRIVKITTTIMFEYEDGEIACVDPDEALVIAANPDDWG